MARYVDRDKAIAYVEEQYRLFYNDESKQAIVEGCVEALKFTPTADVVEVVRCKECEYNADNGGDCDRVLIHTHRNLVTETNEYQYFRLNHCEYGKRKERKST